MSSQREREGRKRDKKAFWQGKRSGHVRDVRLILALWAEEICADAESDDDDQADQKRPSRDRQGVSEGVSVSSH